MPSTRTAAGPHSPITGSTDLFGGSFEPDEIAPVDRQADPAHWLPGRSLLIVAGVVLLLTVITVIVCLLVWLTPPLHPLQIPKVPKV